MADPMFDAVASIIGQTASSNKQAKPASSILPDGPSAPLSINTGHQTKRLLSPAPIGLPPGSADSSRRTSPVPGFLGQHDAAGFDEESNVPSTPKRPALLSRGLSLQLPIAAKDGDTASSTAKPELRTPLTPKLDSTLSYGSPASLIPRRSRGMDFSRAATHLHHSTLAEHPDPESSPIVGGRGISVPRRNGNSAFDSPLRGGNGASGADQSMVSSSVGSMSMIDSGSDSSSDDDIAMRDEDETIHMTPQAGRLSASANITMQSPGGEALAPFTVAASNFMNYRERLRNRGKRKDSNSNKRSSNGWRYDMFSSPVHNSPPIARSIEPSENYFQRELSRKSIASRRESLSLGTDELNIEDPSPNTEDNKSNAMDAFGITSGAVDAENRRNVIKKAVTTRRSHLIPKTKGFARIRAALAEESAPIDNENRREAEVLRQVKEREEHVELKPEDSSLAPTPSQPATTASSPYLAPAASGADETPPDDMSIAADAEQANTRRSSSSFSQQASRHGGAEFWNRFMDEDRERMRTPPPPLFPRGSSSVSGLSEDASMTLETASTNTSIAPPLWPGRESSRDPRTQSPVRTRSNTPTTAVQGEWSRKALGKRRRDDELDAEFFKRRAVSPGLSSIAGSPVLPPSPAQRENAWWSLNREGNGKRETPGGHVAGERVGSGSSESGRNGIGSRGVERRVGMQGMNEAGEGLMNMSID